MVFYHHSYGSMSEAMEHPDGLAVLACMYTVSVQLEKESRNETLSCN